MNIYSPLKVTGQISVQKCDGAEPLRTTTIFKVHTVSCFVSPDTKHLHGIPTFTTVGPDMSSFYLQAHINPVFLSIYLSISFLKCTQTILYLMYSKCYVATISRHHFPPSIFYFYFTLAHICCYIYRESLNILTTINQSNGLT